MMLTAPNQLLPARFPVVEPFAAPLLPQLAPGGKRSSARLDHHQRQYQENADDKRENHQHSQRRLDAARRRKAELDGSRVEPREISDQANHGDAHNDGQSSFHTALS